MRAFPLVVLMSLAGVNAAAQVQSRPTDPPLVTAANESWFRLGEPIQFAGELYYLAGPQVFFNGNTMVRTGHYNGVPLYADTTVEPFSIVLVPVTRGLMQPYERRRRGDLAGTTGSRAPSFPVQVVPDATSLPMAAAPPTNAPLPPGAISVYTPEALTRDAARGRSAPARQQETVGTTGIAPARRPAAAPVIVARRPESNDGIWIPFRGERWIYAGRAVPLAGSGLMQVGEYAGMPVYARRDSGDTMIYLPARGDLVVPYRLKR